MPTPGHSAGHLSVLIAGDDETIFLAGDTSYTEECLLNEAVDGVSSVGGGEAAALDSIRRVHALAHQVPLVYLPTHDPESRDRLMSRSPLLTRLHENSHAATV